MSQLDTDRHASRPAREFRLDKQRGSIAGVCAGIANYFGWDVTMVRLAFVLTTIFLTGAPLIAYLILWAIAD
ncbi:PspC domain-containing protein [Citromicrobium bathyomarinum]|jgi:phage shock protein C|uniref:PspC domain-containing protein n=1 Tax=Alteriqipengyuania abyssalis TaxID=2860200 RepID=A0ABS7PDS4_9SPHN|nr:MULTISPECIES: PspC domain-containing protein [Sphingomonadales]MEC8178509.1 PspC domain-containing protein [Pseudomonadota bacterium]ALG62033.1 phage-shock protein [Citromicrobium sp. JL477]KPM16233.1 phage-shock protein [Citromicrobium sp. JL1351]KPM19304.1 phage-shock protein [Citromicrobium sp. JL31]KPM23873.1 phage-shock protein [Citromicrobium sp. JL2201]